MARVEFSIIKCYKLKDMIVSNLFLSTKKNKVIRSMIYIDLVISFIAHIIFLILNYNYLIEIEAYFFFGITTVLTLANLYITIRTPVSEKINRRFKYLIIVFLVLNIISSISSMIAFFSNGNLFRYSFIIYAISGFLYSVLLFIFLQKIWKDKLKNYSDEKIIIEVKKGFVLICPDTRDLTYNEKTIKIDEIESVELLNQSKIVAKSTIPEAIISGVLFGGIGAIAGSIAGKKEKYVEKYKIMFKTTNIYHSTLFIPASYEECITIANTVFLLIKNKGS